MSSTEKFYRDATPPPYIEKPHQDIASTQAVLVIGGGGLLTPYLIVQLLDRGYKVVTTVSTPSHEAYVRDLVGSISSSAFDRLSFSIADITKDVGWVEAMHGCSFVHYTISPLERDIHRGEEALIHSEKEKALRILRFARNANLKRVLMVSSFTAIGYGHEASPVFNEEHWTVLDGKIPVYAGHRSTTLAERAAWDFIAREGGGLELTVTNPTLVLGPVVSGMVLPPSLQLIKHIIDNKALAGIVRMSYGIVDVRDLADLHIRAMESDLASNERFLATGDYGEISLLNLARLLKIKRPGLFPNVEPSAMSDLVVRAMSWFQPSLRSMARDLGVVRMMSNSKATDVLGWAPRSLEQSVVDAFDSLLAYHGPVEARSGGESQRESW